MDQQITQILQAIQAGEPQARAGLIEAAYDDLKRLATGRMSQERQNHTLTATALVHEVSARLLEDRNVPMEDSKELLAYAARSMRNLLIDHARTKGRKRRGGEFNKVAMEEVEQSSNRLDDDIVALDEALTALYEAAPRKAQVVEFKFFGRMTLDEIASTLDISVATAKRDWEIARAWLRDYLGDIKSN